ncbi:YdcF family protein [Cupriavidus basilensis]
MASGAVVVSGGQDFGLRCSEADVMADYLTTHGLAPDRLIREDRSTSTEENLLFSRRLLEQQGVSAGDQLVLVTSDFHLIRAKRIAHKAGFRTVSGAGAATPLYCDTTPGCASILRLSVVGYCGNTSLPSPPKKVSRAGTQRDCAVQPSGLNSRTRRLQADPRTHRFSPSLEAAMRPACLRSPRVKPFGLTSLCRLYILL